MANLKKVLVNRYELIADEKLRRLADENGDRIIPKPRLADIVDIDSLSRIPGQDIRKYALMAHLDFVMVDTNSTIAKFAVEIDGRQHITDHTATTNDRKKDEICRQARLPLLRIATSDLLRRVGRWDILRYIVNIFYNREAFIEAQAKGFIPPDEPFLHFASLTFNAEGKLIFEPIDAAPLRKLSRYRDADKLPYPGPEYITKTRIDDGQAEAYVILPAAVDPHRYLIAYTEISDFHFPGISAHYLAQEIAVFELIHLVDEWFAGKAVACDSRELARIRDKTKLWMRSGSLLTDTPSTDIYVNSEGEEYDPSA